MAKDWLEVILAGALTRQSSPAKLWSPGETESLWETARACACSKLGH